MDTKTYTQQEMASYIDHTLLQPDASRDDILQICREAVKYRFASVCVNPSWIPLVSKQLKGTEVKTCSVISFPLGSETPEMKAMEASYVIGQGADEVDMVINIGAVKDKNWDFVRDDIKAVVDASKPAIVKVIIETCLLTDEEKVKACQLSEEAGAAFVKTSTGFSTGGATIQDIKLMRRTVGDRLQVKASGGIRTPEFAKELVEAGADRIGAGNGIVLL